MIDSLEKALKETWENKEKFYEDNKNLTIMEILEKVEGQKFNTKQESVENSTLETAIVS